ncbi:hypothetical protein PAMA_010086 [Pampus argenteus]
MNVSSSNVTVVIEYRDSFTKAVAKNVIVVVLGISINYINASLIHTFCKHQIFYTNPRYILFIHLVINDMIQVTLTVALFVISYTLYKINVSVCCAFILMALFTTENTPLNLACMAVECYIAICLPLRHIQICTVKRTLRLIGLIWMTSMLSVLPDLFISLATEQLDFFHTRVFCLRETAFRNPHIIKKRDITYILYLVLVWFFIFYTYFKILLTAKTASKDAKKARNTILLHGFQVLLCMTTYATPQLKESLQQWFPKNYPDSLFACYIIVQLLPRSISPIIYGIRDKTFRKYLKRVNFSRQEMNVSSSNVTVVLQYRDSFAKAVTKNVIVVVLGISINYINASLIHTFCKHQIFYTNPRYILFIHLVVNDMIQLTLTVILFVISYTLYKINVSVCCVFVLIALFTTENTPLNLACMAVECYIAICLPLRHIQICTVKRTLMLIGLIWMTSMLSGLPDLFITLATQPPDFFHSRVFCLRGTAFPHPLIVKKRDITYLVFLVIVFITILYTYFKILFTAKAANKDAKKATNTILLHGFQLLLCMTTYVAPQLLTVLQQWFPKNYVDSLFTYYIIVQVLPRSISPIIYGIRDNTFRNYLKKYLLCKIFKLNPRYILFIHLVLNDMIQLIISITLFIFSYTFRTIYVALCCLLILPAIFTTQNTPLNLAFMAAECYVAVCFPLRYNYDPQINPMNSSYYGHNVSSGLRYRDSSSTAVAKNVIILALGLTINYINGTLIHTFRKHQILPRFISPIVYGLRDKTFRQHLKKYLLCPAVYRDTLNTAVIKNVITVVLCISINYINGTLVHTFRKHQIFNMNPRYILYIHLVINDIMLLTMFTLIQVLSYIVFTLNVSLCITLLMIAIFTNLNNPLTLAVMAIECYIAICFPLHHTQICTVKKTYVVIGLIWAASADAKKARNTVLLHGFQLLLCMLTYVFHLILNGLTHLFPKGILAIRFTIAVFVQILPRLISPVVYGLRDKTFRQYLKRYLFCSTRTHPQKTLQRPLQCP